MPAASTYRLELMRRIDSTRLKISCPSIDIIGCTRSKIAGARQKPSSEHPILEAHSRFAGPDLIRHHLYAVAAGLASYNVEQRVL